jgi:predicted outer membrane repeat protein
VLGLFAAPRADAANTYFVTSTGDSGSGTLRKAIADASAAGSGNTVMFDAGLVGSTITLTSDYILIDKPMYIHGPGANLLTISGGHQSRIFYVKTDTLAGGVYIRGITVTAGNAGAFAGGAIAAKNSYMQLSYSAVTDSTAAVGGGIFAANGPLAVSHSRVSGNMAGSTGGGISAAYSTVLVQYSTISGNTAGTYGGGIYARDTGSGTFFTVFQSTISGNRIPQPGAPTSVGGGGLALVRLSSEAKFVGSTVATNYAFQNGGGIALLDASSASHFQIVDATIASNSSAASSGNGISAVGPVRSRPTTRSSREISAPADCPTSPGRFT